MNNSFNRWDPFHNLTSLQDQMNRLFDDTVNRGRSGESDLATWAPAADIAEAEQELVLKIDLPDVDERNIDIRVEGNTLTIRGERKFSQEIAPENYLRVERPYGPFTRSFSLPNTVKVDAIAAEYRNGVLTLHLPKREEAKPKQIKIAVAANSR